MNINIRLETPADYRRVEELMRDAFWNLYFPGGYEHYTAHKMRNNKNFIKELTFVLEVDGVVQGAILYGHSRVVLTDGSVIPTVTFGPVCIAPHLHRQGLGRMLITHSIEQARAMGHKAIVTMGFRHHYTPYGFAGGRKYGISMPDGTYLYGLLVLPLVDGVFDNVKGYIDLGDMWDMTEQDLIDFEAFDQTFPEKEKLVLPCQADFERDSVRIDTEE